jgi:hypothetical protein
MSNQPSSYPAFLKVIPASEFQPKVVLLFSEFTPVFSNQDRNFRPEFQVGDGIIK